MGWYFLFGILLVPWRLLRRHERNEQRRMLQHREMLSATLASRPVDPRDHSEGRDDRRDGSA